MASISSIFHFRALGVAGVHAVQVAGEQRGLVAAGAGADLDDDVLVVVRVALDHLQPDLLLERLQTRRRLLDDRLQLRVIAVLGEQLAGAFEIVLERPPRRRQPIRGLQLVVLPPTSA